MIAIINKSGSTSLLDVFRDRINVNNHAAIKYERRVAWVRHPVTRLHSCWSFCKTNNLVVPKKHLATYRRFIDYVLRIPNSHWLPQSKQVTHNGVFLPTVVHRFEDIAETFGLYSDRYLPWLMRTKRIAVDESYRADDIVKYYEDDFRLWHSAER